MSTWWGNNFNNHHTGPQKNQYGLGGNDKLVASDSDRSYHLYGGNGDDQLVGYARNDELYGGSGNDNLYGYGGRDYLEGGKGKDKLGGFYGNDVLSGGGGKDTFFFESRLNGKQNFDRILDFDSGEDRMKLDNDVFRGTGDAGHVLSSKKFEIGSEATSSKTRILYNENNGVVYYTPHGDHGKEARFRGGDEGEPSGSPRLFRLLN